MEPPTPESLYVGFLYVGLKRFWQNTFYSLNDFAKSKYTPASDHEPVCAEILRERFFELEVLMNTKKAIRVNLDVSISTSCSGTFTPVEEAVNQFLLQLDYYMARNWENEVAGVNESFGNRYKIQINGMKKAFNQLSQALLKLEEDCPGIKKIKWK